MAFEFDRYINGTLMAEGVIIERQKNLADAMREAARIASRGPNGEMPVLVLRAEAAERALAERAGGVKAPIGYALVPVEPTDRMVSAYVAAKPKGAGFNHPRKGDDKKAWFAAHEKKCRERWKAMLSVSALTTEPAAPEGRQPVAGAVRVCPVRDAICPHGMGCLYNDGMDCDMEASRADLAYQKHAASYTRPAEQAVTDEMVARASAEYQVIFGKYLLSSHARRILKAAMEAGRDV